MFRSASLNSEYVVIDTEANLTAVLPTLEQASHVVLDIEGLDLGNVGGQISVLIIRPVVADATTYIVDVPSLGQDALGPILKLIAADSPIKVMYDGRMDYSELFTSYDVKIGKTLDLQVAEVASRRRLGQTPHEQLRRLPAWLRKIALSNPEFYRPINNIISLGHCGKEFRVTYSDKAKVDHSRWLVRPINKQYLQYAADDARLIELIYKEFLKLGLITGDLPAISQRYIAVWNGEKIPISDMYRQHGLLPLNILDWVEPNPGHLCVKCGRYLPRSCFGQEGRSTDCKVCYALRFRPAGRR